MWPRCRASRSPPAARPIWRALLARYWIERFARLPVEIDVASEFRYREAPIEKGGLTLLISQSGETADTLASLRYAKAQGQKIISVVNVPTSTIARDSDVAAPTLAGPEIGVASTKAFTCQLAAARRVWRSPSAARAARSMRKTRRAMSPS